MDDRNWNFLNSTFTKPFLYYENKGKTAREIRLECVHRCQTYLQLDIRSWSIFEYIICRRNGKDNGCLAGVPLLPSSSREVLRPKSISFPFECLSRRLFCAQRNNLQLSVLNSDEQQNHQFCFSNWVRNKPEHIITKKKIIIRHNLY